ncbi:MAG: ABC transporter ATP-binding protein [Micromonosporaceae bacterium]
MSTAISAQRLGKRYGRTWALRECDVSIPQGRVAALVGPNGAGKTTLLHLAIGLLGPTTGSVAVFGEPARLNRPAGLARVGFVAQDHPLYRNFTVADLLRMGRALNPGWDQALAERRLADVGVPLRQRAGKLSGGQQAQVSLTMALAKRPRLLVLDEPVAGLDPLARRDFMQTLMDAVAADGLTVVLSSHVVSELERVCDYLVLLRAGRVQLAGDIDDLLDGHQLLVGPRVPDSELADIPGLLRAVHGDRHSNLLVKVANGTELHPRWIAKAVSFEELVLCYLETPEREDAP